MCKYYYKKEHIVMSQQLKLYTLFHEKAGCRSGGEKIYLMSVGDIAM